ncbi:MAG: PqqD family protein [Candidatus Riflebacteria bacterium]|nr:PqqD family protein [Candidatus Riflebacteria bacterium]
MPINLHNPLSETLLSRRDGWFTSWIGGELMMMNVDGSVYMSLSGAGGAIWELLEEPHTLWGLCERLAASYDVEPAEIRDEVLAFLEKLHHHHAIQLHPEPPT